MSSMVSFLSAKPMMATQWRIVKGISATSEGQGAVKASRSESGDVTSVVKKAMLCSVTSGRVDGRRSSIRIAVGGVPRSSRCCTIQPPTRPMSFVPH